jgi:hypothetical protein
MLALIEDAKCPDGPLLDLNVRDQASGVTLGMSIVMRVHHSPDQLSTSWNDLPPKEAATAGAHELRLIEAYDPRLLDVQGNDLLSLLASKCWITPGSRVTVWLERLLARRPMPLEIDRTVRTDVENSKGRTAFFLQAVRPNVQNEHAWGLHFSIVTWRRP